MDTTSIYKEETGSEYPIKLIPILIGLGVLGTIGFSFSIHAMLVGHHHALNTTREVPWGLLISPYVFFACLGTGLCIVSSLGQVFKVESFRPIIPRTVFLAMVAMAIGLVSIMIEIENPWRVGLNAFLSPQPSSNIWWKTAIYSLYLIFMLFNFLSLIVKKEKMARIFAIIALVTVAMGNLNMNSDMAIQGSKGFWSDNYMPLSFIALSTITGCAAILLFTWIGRLLNGRKLHSEEDRALQATANLFLILLLGFLYFTGVKIMGGYYPDFTRNPEALYLLVRGDFSFNFWVGEVVLAVLIPLLLIVVNRGKQISVLAIAGLSCLIGTFVFFYDLVMVGQLIPHYYQYNVVDLPRYYSYTPSLHEYMITGGAVFLFLTAFIFGEIIIRKIFLPPSPAS
ncbi:MAG: polysulfide reductase NrfD [Desulfocapsa sp.]|nr:polysulfide reductase NrfD [Desulfocapsa sp.]